MVKQLKILILCATLAAAALVFAQNRQAAQTRGETAGQKFKNIKVLNDMPAEQMGKVMNLMSASLGVNCKFCHTSGSSDFEKDDNEHKAIAREMIKMTLALNKNHFAGRTEITCQTCHNGRVRPQSAPDLHAAARPERPRPPEAKPSVEQLLEKYALALGGRANLARIASRQIKAQRVEPDGRTREAEEIWQQGNKMLVETVYPSKEFGDFVVREIFDGRSARKTGNGAPIELKADEREQIEREARLFANPDLKAVYARMEVGAVEKIDGREVFAVSAETPAGARERLYFDAVTGLLARRVASAPTVLGAFEYQVDYADYKDFGGVRLPASTRFAVPNISWTRRILEVKNNVAIDDEKFR